MKNEKTRIEFDYCDKHYTLEFTADSIKRMEKSGYNFAEMENKSLSSPEDLFCGLFIANHNDVPRAKRIEIFNALTRNADGEEATEEDALLSIMGEMLFEAIEEIRGRGNKGNISWKVVK